MAEREGQHLGNYRLLKLLGEGSFAEVYLGEHTYLGTKAAIKLLYKRVVRDEVALFQQEARTLANLEHPNIVRVRDFNVEASTNTPYLVMDYAPGGTLRERHPKGTRLPLSTMIEYVKQIAAALQYAHDEKVIHRDVKPENILLGRNGALLLSDFGIAKLSQTGRTSEHSAYHTAGTPYYMAPEQSSGKPEKASDQYALAIMVYEWLCGKLPFSEGNALNIQYQHAHEPVPSLRDQLPTLSSAVEQVIMTALAKQPQDRFGSVRAFADALEQASRDIAPQPIVQSPPAPSEPAPLFTPPSHSGSATFLNEDEPDEVAPRVYGAARPHSTRNENTRERVVLSIEDQSTHIIQPSSTLTSRGLSRRAILLGLVGVGVVGTGVLWLTRTLAANTPSSHTPPSHPPAANTPSSHTPSPPTSTPTPRPQPQGTLYVTYNRHSNTVHVVAWSPNGKRIASASWDKTVQVWDATSGSNAITYRGHSDAVEVVAWSPDGTLIASGSDDEMVQVWDAVTRGHIYTYNGHTSGVNAVAWSSDGKRIASGSADRTVQVWDATSGGHVYTYNGHSDVVHAVAWSLDGKRIASASGDSTVQVWDAATGGHVLKYSGHTSGVNAVAWSPDGKYIASGSDGSTVQVWDAASGGHLLTYSGHTSGVNAVAWSPDGKRIASASSDGTVQVWNGATGDNIFTYHERSQTPGVSVYAVAWSLDGTRIASGGSDQTVQVWQAV